MITTWTKEQLLANQCCYNQDQVEALPCYTADNISINTLLDDCPAEDVGFYMSEHCNLTAAEKESLSTLLYDQIKTNTDHMSKFTISNHEMGLSATEDSDKHLAFNASIYGGCKVLGETAKDIIRTWL